VGKGADTRAAILDRGVGLACREGLEQVSFGYLAAQLGMSKSGLCAHFTSQARLHLEIAKAYVRKFDTEVIRASFSQPPGLPRLRAMLLHWSRHLTSAHGREALHINCAEGYPGAMDAVRGELVSFVAARRAALEACARDAVERGQLAAGTDHGQLARELHGIMLLLHFEARFMLDGDAVQRMELSIRRLLGQAPHD
jgi:AcrR family transcriptional regulator